MEKAKVPEDTFVEYLGFKLKGTYAIAAGK